MNPLLETGGYTIELPEGVKPEDVEFVACSIKCRLEPIPGTPFCKLVPIDGTFERL